MPFSTDKSIEVAQNLGVLEVRDESVSLDLNVKALNFIGAAVTASESSGVVDVTIASGDAVVFGAKYVFNTSTSSPPSSGELRINNADPTLATEIYVHETDRNTADASGLLDFLTLNSVLGLIDESDPTAYHFYELTSQIDNGGDRTYSVSYLYGTGTLAGNITLGASVRGPQGIQGPAGTNGADGVSGFGIRYLFNSNTASPPASGEVRLNNATLSSVTELYISESDRNSSNVETVLAEIIDGSTVMFIDETDVTSYAFYLVNTQSDNVNFRQYNVTHLGSNGTLDGNLVFAFAKVGPAGAAGAGTDLAVANINASTLDITSSSGQDTTIPAAVATTSAGLLTGADKAKLDGVATGAEVNRSIEDEGVAVTDREILDFQGSGVTVTDDAGNSKTVITIPGGGGGSAIEIENDGTSLTTDATKINFVPSASGITITSPSTGEIEVNFSNIVAGSGGGSGGANYTILGEENISAAGTTSIQFSTISQDYDELLIVGQAKSSGAGEAQSLLIYFNGDTTNSNYHHQSLSVNNTNASASESAAPRIGIVPGSGAVTDSTGDCWIKLANYSSTTELKRAVGHTTAFRTTSSVQQVERTVYRKTNVSAITQIDLQIDGGDEFAIGTNLKLVGVNYASSSGGGSSQLEASSTNLEQQVMKFPTSDGTKMLVYGTINPSSNPHTITWDEAFANTDYTFTANVAAASSSNSDRSVFEIARTTSTLELRITVNSGSSTAPFNYIAFGDASVATADLGGGSGSLQLIERIEVTTADQTSYTFSNIPQTYTHLRIEAITRNEVANVGANIDIAFNGDTNDSNYRFTQDDRTSTSESYSTNDARDIIACTGSQSPANSFAFNEIRIPFYTKTNILKTAIGKSTAYRLSTQFQVTEKVVSTKTATAAITSITLSTNANYSVGTEFELWGIV